MNYDVVTNGGNNKRFNCSHKHNGKCKQECNELPKHNCLLAKDFVVSEEYWDEYFKGIISPASVQCD